MVVVPLSQAGALAETPQKNTTATEIHNWIQTYPKMPFAFVGSCGGMCDVTAGHLSYEFRKGSTQDTSTVGYCGMTTTHCSNCWTVSVDWQNALFDYMNQGDTVKQAFDKALADYPQCASAPSCMRFTGDTNFAVVPIVGRTKPDLIITSISSDAAFVGGEAPVELDVIITVANQGIHDVTQDFYVDIHYDPSSPPIKGQVGDAWKEITQTVYAGTSIQVTFTHTFSSGDHEVWAQVDADGFVLETDEDNNIYGPHTITMLWSQYDLPV